MLKTISIIAIMFTCITSYAQEQKRPTELSLTITDTMFVNALVPRLEAGIKLIQNSTIATKESLPVIQGLHEAIQFMNVLITSQMEQAKSIAPVGTLNETKKGKKNK